QLDAVNALSSHIEASSTHALIEYHWGDFKHDPIDVLHQFFDGFLYWANWGAPELAMRFPHGTLPVDLLAGYDLDDFVTFTQHPDYDILDIHFGEMEAPDEWTEAAQQALAELLQVPQELLVAVAGHSSAAMSSTNDDFVAWIELLPQERRNDYLVRL